MATGGIYSVSVTPDKSYKTIIKRLQRQGGVGVQEAVAETVLRMREVVINVLQLQFRNAYERSPDVFPLAYLLQLLLHAEGLPVQVEAKEYSFTIGFNIGDLGDQEELSQGYHYGAALASGGTVTLPYGSAQLKNDVVARYAFWQTLRYHLVSNGGRPLSGSLWDETVSARVAYWNSIGKAPQWLLLQYGQTTYPPTNQPFPIVENARELIGHLGRAIFADELVKSYNRMRRAIGQENHYPKDLMAKATDYAGSLETDYLSPGEVAAKSAKMPAMYKAYTMAVVNAKTNEEVLRSIVNVSSLEGVAVDLLMKEFGGK